MAFLIPIVIFLLIRGFMVLGKKLEQMVEEDELQFKKLLTESEQGLVDAQYEIALKYLKGNGTKKDEAKAVYWFEQSAEQGNTEGQFSSARLYSKGKGVNQSYSRAAYWYEKAAQQGHIEAQFRLANIYLEGIGTEQSNSKAFEWTSFAANNEHGQAQSNLGWFYLEGKIVNKDLIKASEWFDKAVQKDIADAQFYLGLMYLEGIGREVDQDKAAELFKKAAKQNHVEAQYLMGVCYAEGIGVEQNIYLVFHWVSKASDQGHSKAQTELGIMYLTGKNKYAPQNNSKAFNLFLQAARQGRIEAQRQVAKMYYEGIGIEKDIYEADKWLDRSTKEDHSHSEAQPNYDFEYEDKDKPKAQPADFKLLQITQEISSNDELLSVREGNNQMQINKKPTLNDSNVIYATQVNQLLEQTLNKPSVITISISCRFDWRDVTFRTLGYSASFGNAFIPEDIDAALKDIVITTNDERFEYWFNDGINIREFCTIEDGSNYSQFDKSKWHSNEGKAIDNIEILDTFIYDIEKINIPIIYLMISPNIVNKWLILTIQKNEFIPKSKYFKDMLLH
jgi:hypothetical protein